MFFSFDGIDGVGKSTQVRLFVEALRGAGLEVVECRDPGSTALGERIRDLLLNQRRRRRRSSRRSEMLLYMAARAQLVEEVIRPALGGRQDCGLAIVTCWRTWCTRVTRAGWMRRRSGTSAGWRRMEFCRIAFSCSIWTRRRPIGGLIGRWIGWKAKAPEYPGEAAAGIPERGGAVGRPDSCHRCGSTGRAGAGRYLADCRESAQSCQE